MKVQAKKIEVDTIKTKIQLMQDNEEVYKSVYGNECYSEIMVGLLDILRREIHHHLAQKIFQRD